MSYYAFKNNLKATLHYDMTDTDTVIWLKQLVTSTDPDTRLAAWPTCDASHTFTLTLESTEDSKIREIVECTGVTANTTDYIAFSCTRAKENTVAIAHNKNATNVENRITAAALTTIVDALATTVASVTANTASISTITSSVNALSSTLIGSIQSVMASSTYVPNGCVPADGAEYTKAQFTTLYTDYLASGKLLTCTYTEWTAQVGLTGNCAKFALDTTNQKFKVPLLKDGDSITQANSAAELGKSVKAGLPDLIGTIGIRTGYEMTGVFENVANSSGAVLGAFGTTDASVTNKPQFRASKWNSIYGNSTTVTDEQVRLRHFVVVASAQNNASVFDWSNYMVGLAGKVNTDLSNVDLSKANIVLQQVRYETGAYASTSATIPMDDTIPQITEGAQVMSAAITPKSASSKIVVDVHMFIAGNGSNHSMAALFKDSVSDAIESCLVTTSGSNYGESIAMKKTLTLGDTATHTFSVRMGPYSGTMYLNGNSAGRLFGGTFISSITITEYAA